jgi:hypothetical protein
MPSEKHALTVQLPPDRARLIARSLEAARARESLAGGPVSPYWQHHKEQAAFSILDEARGIAQLRGESGFYFPGRSYSELDWLNMIDRLAWLGLQRPGASLGRAARGRARARPLPPGAYHRRRAPGLPMVRPASLLRLPSRAVPSPLPRALPAGRGSQRRAPPGRARDRARHRAARVGAAPARSQQHHPPGRPAGNPALLERPAFACVSAGPHLHARGEWRQAGRSRAI